MVLVVMVRRLTRVSRDSSFAVWRLDESFSSNNGKQNCRKGSQDGWSGANKLCKKFHITSANLGEAVRHLLKPAASSSREMA